MHEEHHPLLTGASIRQLVLRMGPAPGRLPELEALSQLSANPAARIYIGFDKHLGQPQHASD